MSRGPRISRSVGVSAAVAYLAGDGTFRDLGKRFGMTAGNLHRWVRKLQKEQPVVAFRQPAHPEDELTL